MHASDPDAQTRDTPGDLRYGCVISAPGGAEHELVDLAAAAEAAGWDGVFVPDCIEIDSDIDPEAPGLDPWVLLTAMAMRTRRVRLGTMITPLSRRRPWKVARETATLDRLSGGRLVLPVGLGALDDRGFGAVGEATDRKTRAELLDESLDIITRLWSGERFSYSGKHYQVHDLHFQPIPAQRPRIPIWVVGAWPSERSFARVLRYDGLLPNKLGPSGGTGDLTPSDIRDMAAYIAQHRAQQALPFDIVVEGETPGDDPVRAAQAVRPWAQAGATWWLEAMWTPRLRREGYADALTGLRTRVGQGPPRL